MRVDPGAGGCLEPEWHQRVLGALANDELLSDQSRRRLGQVICRLAAYLSSGHGIVDLSQVTADHVRGFVGVRSASGSTPSVATMHLRRSAVRLTFRVARDLGLASGDPSIDLALQARSSKALRPLADDEVGLCRISSLSSLTETRLPAIWALSEATARTSEIPAIRIRDVDRGCGRVFLHGGSKVEPRWSVLTAWGSLQLERRVKALSSLKDTEALIAYAGDGSPESRQASAANAIRTILVHAGLGDEPDLRPASVAAWAGARFLADGHPIEEVARRLGMRSIDACVRLIGYDWKASR